MKADKATAVPRRPEREASRNLSKFARDRQPDPAAKPKKALAKTTKKRVAEETFVEAFVASRGRLDPDLEVGF